QARLQIATDHVRREVRVVAARPVAHRAALREDEDAIAATSHGPSDDLLRPAPPVEGSGVDPVDALLDRGVDGADGVGFVLWAPVDRPAGCGPERRRPHTDAGDLEVARAKPKARNFAHR